MFHKVKWPFFIRKYKILNESFPKCTLITEWQKTTQMRTMLWDRKNSTVTCAFKVGHNALVNLLPVFWFLYLLYNYYIITSVLKNHNSVCNSKCIISVIYGSMKLFYFTLCIYLIILYSNYLPTRKVTKMKTTWIESESTRFNNSINLDIDIFTINSNIN